MKKFLARIQVRSYTMNCCPKFTKIKLIFGWLIMILGITLNVCPSISVPPPSVTRAANGDADPV